MGEFVDTRTMNGIMCFVIVSGNSFSSVVFQLQVLYLFRFTRF